MKLVDFFLVGCLLVIMLICVSNSVNAEIYDKKINNAIFSQNHGFSDVSVGLSNEIWILNEIPVVFDNDPLDIYTVIKQKIKVIVEQIRENSTFKAIGDEMSNNDTNRHADKTNDGILNIDTRLNSENNTNNFTNESCETNTTNSTVDSGSIATQGSRTVYINPNNGTIRECLNKGYTDIHLASGVYKGVDNRGVIVNENISIVGGNGVIIDGENSNRIFSMNSGRRLTLIDIGLINGCSDKGGLIYCCNGASIDIINCSLNDSKSKDGGGGIYLSNNDNPSNIRNSVFLNNRVDAFNGGAIYNNNSTLSIENSIFRDNHGYFGGAIYNSLFASKRTTITNSIFESNNCGANGGAIFNVDGAGFTIRDSSFKGNYMNPAVSSNGEGGAIYNKGSKDFNIHNTNFIENCAVRGACIYNDDDGEVNLFSSNLTGNTAGAGGGIYNNKGAFYITDVCNINDNVANSNYGGAIVNKNFIKMTISNVDNNKCNKFGGAIYSTAGDVIIADCELNNNSAVDTGGAISAANTNIGVTTTEFKGNIAGTGGAIHANSCKLNFNGGRRGGNSFVGNKAKSYDGGALFLMGETSGSIGNTRFEANGCQSRGGAIFYGKDVKCINKTTNSAGSVVLLDNIQYLSNNAKSGSNVYSSKYGDMGNIGEN